MGELACDIWNTTVSLANTRRVEIVRYGEALRSSDT